MLFFKAQLSAQVSTFVDFAVTLVVSSFFDVYYVVATFLGALSGGISNCIINYRWVFHSGGQHKRSVAIKYFIVWGVSIALNTLGTYVLTEISGQYFFFAKIVAAVMVGIFWNYQMQRFFVYRNRHIKEKLRNEGRRIARMQKVRKAKKHH